MKQWNDEKLKKRYDRIKEGAIKSPAMASFGYDESFFQTPTLEGWKFPTHSAKQRARIEAAYTLGRMRAIKDMDDGKDLIVLSQADTESPWIPINSGRLPEENVQVQINFIGHNDGMHYCCYAYISGNKWYYANSRALVTEKIVEWTPTVAMLMPYTGE